MNLNKTTYFLELNAEDHTKTFPKLKTLCVFEFRTGKGFFSKTDLEHLNRLFRTIYHSVMSYEYLKKVL